MKSTLLATLVFAGLISVGLPLTAAAEEPAAASAFHWSSGAVFGTSRMFRGQQQTDGHAAISAEVKLAHDTGAYAGIWAGSLNLGPGTDTKAEIDYFVGWGQRYGAWSVNTGYLYRQRPSSSLSLDFQEVLASAVYDFGPVRTGVGIYYSWDYFQGGNSTYTYTNLRVPFGPVKGAQVTGSVAVGHHDFSNRAVGNYNDIDLRLIARSGSLQYSIGYSNTDVKASQSGLLTRDRAGGRARAEVLVMF
ncbi:MAG TPA: TorF family putative porin [Roseateles sp.]|uniref:TorF family putative porin n=1 Tax=Roseateles sp. TaxID=1971397 RepID=UPI002ED99165